MIDEVGKMITGLMTSAATKLREIVFKDSEHLLGNGLKLLSLRYVQP